MSILHDAFHGIKEFYVLPFHLWNGYNDCTTSQYIGWNGRIQTDRWCSYNEPDKLSAAIFGLLVLITTGLAILAAAGIIHLIRKKYIWYRYRLPCQHCQKYTLFDSAGLFAGCVSEQPCCADCTLQHELDAYPKLDCPKDGTTMEVKYGWHNFYHFCTECGGHFLEDGVFTDIINQERRRASSSNTSSIIMAAAIGGAISAGS